MNTVNNALVAGIAAAILFSGCGSSKETEAKGSDAPPRYVDELREYEEDFRPSDFDDDVQSYFPKQQDQHDLPPVKGGAYYGGIPREEDLSQGFRVQLFSSTNIDEANEKKAEAEKEFPEEWFYLVYDAPTYKVRGGNFQTRFEADKFAKLLSEKGHKMAWVVPEKIILNPGARPQEPEGK